MSDVLVVGSDVVAAAAALGLARAGIGVELVVVEATRSDPGADLGVVPWSAVAALDQLGCLDVARVVGTPSSMRSVRIPATGEDLRLDLAVLDDVVDQPFDLLCEAEPLVEALVAEVEQHPSARVTRVTSITGLVQGLGWVEIAFDTEVDPGVRRGRWLVAADGVNSEVRRLAGLGFPGSTWHERCVVAWVSVDLGTLGFAPTTTVVDPAGGALAQFSGIRWRLAFTEPSTLPTSGLADRVALALTRAGLPGDVAAESLWFGRMHERTAARYRIGRVLLAGEAAHTTNLLSGDGLAPGLLDVAHLVEALVGDDPVGALDGYSEDRRRDFVERVLPASADRLHLITASSDAERLEVEVDPIRNAVASRAAQRELLLFGQPTRSGGRAF